MHTAPFKRTFCRHPLDYKSNPMVIQYDIANSQEADATKHTHIKLDSVVKATQEEKKFVTYVLNFTRIGKESKPILTDLFLAENGTLALDIVHGHQLPLRILADREPFLNALVADPSKGDIITIRNFPFENSAVYHLNIGILTVNNIRNIFATEDVPKADILLSPDVPANVGEVRVIPEFPFAAMVLAAALFVAVMLGTKGLQRIRTIDLSK